MTHLESLLHRAARSHDPFAAPVEMVTALSNSVYVGVIDQRRRRGDPPDDDADLFHFDGWWFATVTWPTHHQPLTFHLDRTDVATGSPVGGRFPSAALR